MTTITIPVGTTTANLSRATRLVRRLTRRARRAGVVTVTLTADATGFTAAMTRAAAAAGELAESLDQRRLREAQHQLELAIVRGEARWLVRGGLKPMFVKPEPGQTLEEARVMDRDITVRAMLTAAMPSRWVLAYLRGWLDTYGVDAGARDPYVLHTLLGDTPIEVHA